MCIYFLEQRTKLKVQRQDNHLFVKDVVHGSFHIQIILFIRSAIYFLIANFRNSDIRFINN